MIAEPDFSCINLRSTEAPMSMTTGKPVNTVAPASQEAHSAIEGSQPMPSAERLQFAVIASDGLWDVVGMAPACLLVKRELAAGNSASHCAEALAKLAISCGTADNVTCICVLLN